MTTSAVNMAKYVNLYVLNEEFFFMKTPLVCSGYLMEAISTVISPSSVTSPRVAGR